MRRLKTLAEIRWAKGCMRWVSDGDRRTINCGKPAKAVVPNDYILCEEHLVQRVADKLRNSSRI